MSRSFWLIAVISILTLILYRSIPYGSDWMERWYSQGVFKIFRECWDHTAGHSPIGFIYVLISFILIYLLQPFFSRSQKRIHWKIFITRFFKVIGLLIISFYWLWGFNYKRTPFSAKVALPKVLPDEQFVFDEYCRVLDSLEILRFVLSTGSSDTIITEKRLRNDLTSTFARIPLPAFGNVRIRKVIPKGSLLRISTAGVYLPFTGEGHIDAGLHPIVQPFTIMHEMSHGYGWTGEDECNFLGLLGAINSNSPYIRYSGYFAYWRYLRSQIFQIDKNRFEIYYREIPLEILGDYRKILAYTDRYPDIFPQMRDLFYDSYLKSHGISDGLFNYSQMIVLSYQWQVKHGNLLFRSVAKTESK